MLKAFIDRDAYFPSSENGGRQSLLLGLSGGLGALGILLMLNGFTLLVPVPFLG